MILSSPADLPRPIHSRQSTEPAERVSGGAYALCGRYFIPVSTGKTPGMGVDNQGINTADRADFPGLCGRRGTTPWIPPNLFNLGVNLKVWINRLLRWLKKDSLNLSTNYQALYLLHVLYINKEEKKGIVHLIQT
jgi:hypothetical protein